MWLLYLILGILIGLLIKPTIILIKKNRQFKESLNMRIGGCGPCEKCGGYGQNGVHCDLHWKFNPYKGRK